MSVHPVAPGCLEAESGPLAAGAQENIAAAGKYINPGESDARRKTRDWQLYFFFRILTRAEAHAAALTDGSGPQPAGSPGSLTTAQEIGLLNPALFSMTLPDLQRASTKFETGDATRAAEAFRNWLGVIAGKRGAGELAPELVAQLATEAIAETGMADLSPTTDIEAADKAISETGSRTIGQGLAAVVHYEILRHHWLAERANAGGAIRPQLDADDLAARTATSVAFDTASINLAFTFSGLKQLRLSELVLRSFPDAFRDGMAARAARLHDVGPSAPENWYGELGSARVHGYFTGGFAADQAPASAWKALRREIDQFNTRQPPARDVRARLQRLFSRLGMELMHIELGQAPYAIDASGGVRPIMPRVEHFGFRDGVSQPFLDVKLGADGRLRPPALGGATPGRNRTWTPLATGEVYLGYPDEDGHAIEQPANRLLRHAGTYLVFRKLAQDVIGFRNFLKSQRPGSKEAQDLLGAQMVGRWKSGASLVKSPVIDVAGDEAGLNDFRYADGDLQGEKCPLGAHVRRVNPRDTGGRNNVRRHRIMRRSMAYGGELLGEDASRDDEERGLLFIAANSRIDMQFEVIQADWLNRGEFLGQAGLGKCPLLGSHDGARLDAFMEAGKSSPVTGLPRFVIMRGGDYFFAPSVDALRGLADEAQSFPPDLPAIVAHGHSFGDGRTEGLFSEERLTPLVMEVLYGKKAPVGFRLPQAVYGQASFGAAVPVEPPEVAQDVVFVRSHKDVSFVLNSRPGGSAGEVAFTAAHSQVAGQRMLGRGNLLVGTDWDGASPSDRVMMLDILREVWDARASHWRAQLGRIVKQTLNEAVARTAPSGRIDLVRDFAADATFAVVTRLFGVGSPDFLTELAIATPFGRRHVGQVHADWLAVHAKSADDNPGLVTLKLWSFLVGLNLVGDFQLQRPLIALGQQAASEALLHIEALLAQARERRPGAPDTLLTGFVAKEQILVARHGISIEAYYVHVRSLIFELALTASAIVPAVFGKLMDASFRFGIDLATLVPALDAAAAGAAGRQPEAGIEALIYELNRLDPALPLVLRHCRAKGGAVLPSGVRIKEGQWVAALIAGANLDAAAFPSPDQFSLGGLLPGAGPSRRRERYLMFGVQPGSSGPMGSRICWGRDRVALYTLTQCVRAAAELPGLRRVPGPEGQLKKLLGIASGLKARFTPFAPG